MHRVIRIAVAVIGGLLGYPIANLILNNRFLMNYIPIDNDIIIYIVCILLSAIILYFIYPFLVNALRKITISIENTLRGNGTLDILIQVLGLTIGLILAALISLVFSDFPVPGFQWILQAVIYIVLGSIGWSLARNRMAEIKAMFMRLRRRTEIVPAKTRTSKKREMPNAKLLDTSVIIDGRIIDIFETDFVEGPLIIPVYVLNELQLISDSSDDLKRNKGRRGLDIVAQLEEDYGPEIIILEEDYSDIKDVDSKLIQTAKDKKWKIITNDYNLNKLASVQGIGILNINDLANAVKMVLLPGEEINVNLIKAGKEQGQAVAYLEDGTMIVVENGKSLIGKNVDVVVTSVLQTSAGRMIFAKSKGE